jgi:hypothetical protein
MKVWFVGLLAAVLAIGIMAPLIPSRAADPSPQQQLLGWLEGRRAISGLGSLQVSPSLTSVAQRWTDHLVATGTLAHNTSLGAQAPSGWTHLGENVGDGVSVAAIETAFWASPEHRANILGEYQSVGIGVAAGADGTVFVTTDFMLSPSASAAAYVTSAPGPPSAASPAGFYVLSNDGGILAEGGAPYLGSVPGLGIRTEAASVTVNPTSRGYWVLDSHGSVFPFGGARSYGSPVGTDPTVNSVDISSTKTGLGYWVLAQNGAVFSYGDAHFLGSLPGAGIHEQAVKLVPTPTGRGYWILGADGGIFSFGDAPFLGSLPGLGIHNTSVALASTPSGLGYWVLGQDGGVFTFGDAQFHGSLPGLGAAGSSRAVQIIGSRTSNGYYLLSNDGRLFGFGNSYEAVPGGEPTVNAVGMAAANA